jgi:hypothetical protein
VLRDIQFRLGEKRACNRTLSKSALAECLEGSRYGFGSGPENLQIRQTSALLYCPREATSAALGPNFGHPSRLNFGIERRDSMLRRYATVAFAVLGLLVFDWEDPSPESTLVLDAFDGIAEIIDTLETDPASKRRDTIDRQGIERLI